MSLTETMTCLREQIAQPETRRWYAQMLIDRDVAGDRDKARTLLGEAVELYRTIGMPMHLEMAGTRCWRSSSGSRYSRRRWGNAFSLASQA